MNDKLIFNHHSLPFSDQYIAQVAMPDFLRICIRASRIGLTTILTDDSVGRWDQVELANGFSFGSWINTAKSQGALRDQLRAFLSISTKSPFFGISDIDRDVALLDVTEETTMIRYQALRAAVWHQAPIVSFPTLMPWNQTPLSVTVESLVDGNVESSHQQLDNFFSLQIWTKYEQKYRQLREASGHTAKAWWDNHNRLCPNLILCGSAPSQIQTWSHGSNLWRDIADSLSVLNAFAQEWQTSMLNVPKFERLRTLGLRHRVSGESNNVINNPAKRSTRIFHLPDGRSVVFEDHIKFSQSGVRVHFYADEASRKVYVGYIGGHLPT